MHLCLDLPVEPISVEDATRSAVPLALLTLHPVWLMHIQARLVCSGLSPPKPRWLQQLSDLCD